MSAKPAWRATVKDVVIELLAALLFFALVFAFACVCANVHT